MKRQGRHKNIKKSLLTLHSVLQPNSTSQAYTKSGQKSIESLLLKLVAYDVIGHIV